MVKLVTVIETLSCPACHGSGRNGGNTSCGRCSGSGSVSMQTQR